MAEGDASQNKAGNPKSEVPKDILNVSPEKKRSDKAAERERERRRRRRRKRAMLKKLQQGVETIKETGVQPVPFPPKKKLEKQVLPEVVKGPQSLEKRQPLNIKPEKHKGPRFLPKQQPVIQKTEHFKPIKPLEKQQHFKGAKKEEVTMKPGETIIKPVESVKKPEVTEGKPEVTETTPKVIEAKPEEAVIKPAEIQLPPSEKEPESGKLPLSREQVLPKVEPEVTHKFSGPLFPQEPPKEETHEQPGPYIEEPEMPPIPPMPHPEEKLPVEEEEAELLTVQEESPKLQEKPRIRERVVPSKESLAASDEELREKENLHAKKTFSQAAPAFSASMAKSKGEETIKAGPIFNFRRAGYFIVLVLLGGLLYAGYAFQIYQKAYGGIVDFFKPKQPVKVEVQVDHELLSEWGIETALIFADNRGSENDLLAPAVKNSFFFGKLAEAAVKGETGITPAYYYGLGQDIVAQSNLFIGYIKNLRELQDLYNIDVYAMLDQTSDRQQKLDDYQNQLTVKRDKSQQIVKELGVEIDDLKVSYDSLNSDKTTSEKDFFVALQALTGDKADMLLKTFVDVSQKQTALKARMSALQTLLDYYNSALKSLVTRITAIDKNKAALVQGIHVVDIPGANLNIILQQNQ